MKALAFGMFLSGIMLLVIINFMNLTPAMEMAVLLFFGVAGGLYLVGRGRSILLQYHAVNDRIAAEKSRTNDREENAP